MITLYHLFLTESVCDTKDHDVSSFNVFWSPARPRDRTCVTPDRAWFLKVNGSLASRCCFVWCSLQRALRTCVKRRKVLGHSPGLTLAVG